MIYNSKHNPFSCIMLLVYIFSELIIWFWRTNCWALLWERLFLLISTLLSCL